MAGDDPGILLDAEQQPRPTVGLVSGQELHDLAHVQAEWLQIVTDGGRNATSAGPQIQIADQRPLCRVVHSAAICPTLTSRGPPHQFPLPPVGHHENEPPRPVRAASFAPMAELLSTRPEPLLQMCLVRPYPRPKERRPSVVALRHSVESVGTQPPQGNEFAPRDVLDEKPHHLIDGRHHTRIEP